MRERSAKYTGYGNQYLWYERRKMSSGAQSDITGICKGVKIKGQAVECLWERRETSCSFARKPARFLWAKRSQQDNSLVNHAGYQAID